MTKKTISSIFFSIIVPVFNAQGVLDKCLQAIISLKNFEDCELIVADDASTDSTLKIAKKYQAKIVSGLTNRGAASVRNLGAKLARGEILLFVDSDVILPKDALNYIKEDLKLLDICGIDGVYDERVIFGNFLSAYKHLSACFGQPISKIFNPVASSAILVVSRRIFLNSGGFNEKYTGVMAEDIEFSIRLVLKEKKYFLIDPRIKGLHFKRYNLWTLLKTDYLRIKGIAKTIRKDDYKKMYLKSCGAFLGIPPLFMALAAGFFVLSLIWPFFLWGVLISIIIFVLVQVKFFKYLRKKKNTSFALLAIGFSFIEMLFTIIWASYFSLIYRLKE